MFVISLLGPLLLGAIVMSGMVVCSPVARSSRFSHSLQSIGFLIPPFALTLVWGIALGTWLATGSWPVRCSILFQAGEVVFVGNPPDGYWGLLRFFAQLMLAGTIGVLLGLPVAGLLRWLRPRRDWTMLDWRRVSAIVLCVAAIVASYYTPPGQGALDWIID